MALKHKWTVYAPNSILIGANNGILNVLGLVFIMTITNRNQTVSSVPFLVVRNFEWEPRLGKNFFVTHNSTTFLRENEFSIKQPTQEGKFNKKINQFRQATHSEVKKIHENEWKREALTEQEIRKKN